MKPAPRNSIPRFIWRDPKEVIVIVEADQEDETRPADEEPAAQEEEES